MLKPSIVAIIPAKSVSRRLPDKNQQTIYGIPLYRLTSYKAAASGVFSEIYTSSDIPLHVDQGRFHLRKPELCGDVPSVNVCAEVLRHFYPSGPMPDWCCLLQPTSPLLKPSTIEYAAKLCMDNVDAVIGGHNPVRTHPISGTHMPCGAFYFVRSYLLLEMNTSFSAALAAWDTCNRVSWVPVPAIESLDVDAHSDLAMARAVYDMARAVYDQRNSRNADYN